MKIIFVFLTMLIIQIPFNKGNAQTTYMGHIAYKHYRTTTAIGGGGDGFNWNVDINQNYVVEGRFNVVFTGGVSPTGVAMFQFTGISEDINFINTDYSEAKEEKISQPCYDGLMRYTHTVTPGNSRIHKVQLESERLEPDKQCVTSGFLGIQCPPSNNKEGNCKYSIMLMGNIKTNTTSALYEEETFPCIEENSQPAKTITNTFKMDYPIVIHVEKDFNITDEILEGESTIIDLHSTDCRGCLGPVAGRMVHGEVSCAFDEISTISWYLVKRTKECEPVITYLKGDVKINGKPAEQGGRGIEEGDIIETGSHSRIELNMGNNESIRLGSKSQLRWHDPCKPKKPLSDREAYLKGMRLTTGRAYWILHRIVGKDSNFEVTCGTITMGVRGQLIPASNTYYASADPNFIQNETDPEKAELIEGYQYLSDNQTAFYIHFEDDVIKDISNLKGKVRIKDNKGILQIDLPEGTSTNKWENGLEMTEVLILTK